MSTKFIPGLTHAVAITTGMLLSVSVNSQTFDPPELTELEQLGKHVFFDTKLSKPKTEGCVSCHDPAWGWTFPDSTVNEFQVVAPGALHSAVGGIKTPANAYAGGFARVFGLCEDDSDPDEVCGGMFWDGRAEGHGKTDTPPLADVVNLATGELNVSDTITEEDLPEGKEEYAEFLGPVADQALNPFGNPVEQHIDPKIVCKRVEDSDYAELYEQAYGESINCKNRPENNPAYLTSFKRLAVALSAYQASADVNSFTSPRDIALRQELACACDDDAVNPETGEVICTAEVEAVVSSGIYDDEDTCADENYINSPGTFPLVGLSDEANLGHDIFYNELPRPGPRGNCDFCHRDTSPDRDGTGLFQIYTEQTYENIGVPFNPELPGVAKFESIGLSGHYNAAGATDGGGDPLVPPGLVKTPPVRNNAKMPGGAVKAYTHNGYFKSLKRLVHFYNTGRLNFNCVITDDEDCTGRGETAYEELTASEFGITRCKDASGNPVDMTDREAELNNCWPEPEFPDGAAIGFRVGNLGLTDAEEDALVAYIEALSDQYTPTAP